MLEFFTEERGIRAETLDAFGVEVAGNVASFTYPHGVKHRKHEGEKRQFWSEPKGVKLGLFGIRELYGQPTMFLVEGETDAMRLWQALSDDGVEGVGVAAIPGINAWEGDFTAHFAQADTVYVVLDNDQDYKVQAAVDKGWLQIRKSLGKKAKRLYLPDGVKDLCEFFNTYDLNTLRMLADRKESGLWHYEAMDLSKQPQAPDWLVQDLLCKGDITLMIGEPGVYKSWLSMSLAVAVAESWKEWLGRALSVSGNRVLYVDEENPEGLVLWRLSRLGLTKTGTENIRYLHRQGVRLDRFADRILEEALDWEPSLIVLDSLTRLHTKDENNAGEVAGLFNDGINPLARETGATTLILHHVNKSDSQSSFARTRGSGDLSASIDSGLDVRKADDRGGIAIHHYKSRWIQEGSVIRARLEDATSGGVEFVINDRPLF